MPRFRVDIGGTADVYRTVYVNANNEESAKRRAKKVASGETEDLTMGERVEPWRQSTTPRRLYISGVEEDEG